MVALKDWVSQVPVIAPVAIMVIAVSAETFDWKRSAPWRHPRLVQRRHAGHRGCHHRHAQPGGWRGRGRGAFSGVFFAFKVSRMLDVRMHDDAQTGNAPGACPARCSLPRPMRSSRPSTCWAPKAARWSST